MKQLTLVIALVLAVPSLCRALAQTPPTADAGKPAMAPMTMPQAAPASVADKALSQDMGQMDKSMMAVHDTGNADRDFVLNMIPHHQGAVTMAQTELQYGTDPSLRTLSLAIIRAQMREITYMKAWLAAHPAK